MFKRLIICFSFFLSLIRHFIAVVLCNIKLSFETTNSFSPKKSVISRRAIDGTRGRKYYDPVEDGFFDDYSFDGGQYDANHDSLDLEDIRRNVPGEPGVDYPAYQRLPQTSFSCEGRVRGYYADEEAGCQLFHVCDDILVSSFLCPVGSIFSQKLLTCDWWNKVDCSLTRKFYEANRHIYDQDDDEMLRKAYAMTSLRVGSYERKDRDKDGRLVTFVAVESNGNDLPNGYEDILVDPDYRTYSANVDYPSRNDPNEPFHGHILYSQDYRTKAPKIYQDSPIVRIHKITDEHRTAYEHQEQTKSRKQNSYKHPPINEFENEFQPSYAPTVPTVTTTTRRYYSPTVPTMYRSSTPSYSKRDQSFQGSNNRYTHRDESQIHPTLPTVFYRDNSFLPTPNPIGQVRKVDITHYSQKHEDKPEDYTDEFGEDMEVRESIGLAQSKDERSKNTVEKDSKIDANQKENNSSKFGYDSKRVENVTGVEENKQFKGDSHSSIGSKEDLSVEEPSITEDYRQQSTTEHVSTLPPPTTLHSDVVVQYHSTRGVKALSNKSVVSTEKPRVMSTENYSTTSSPKLSTDSHDSESSSTAKSSFTFRPIFDTIVSKPANILQPPEVDQGFRITIPESFFSGESTQTSSLLSEFSTIEYRPYTSPSKFASTHYAHHENSSDPSEDHFNKVTTPSTLPVSHLPTINIPATEIIPPFTHLFAGGHYGTYPTTSSPEPVSITNQDHFYYETDNNSTSKENDTSASLSENISVNPLVPEELQPPVFNRQHDFHDFTVSPTNNFNVSSTEETISHENLRYNDRSEISDKNEGTDNTQTDTQVEVIKSQEGHFEDHSALKDEYEDKGDDYDHSNDDVNYPGSDDNVDQTPEDDLPQRFLNLFQIMAELAKTNRFPRPFTHNEPLTINVMSTTPKPNEDTRSRNSSRRQVYSVQRENSERRRDGEPVDYPVYRHEEHFAETKNTNTEAPLLEESITKREDNTDESATASFSNDSSSSKEDELDRVETEFVPSLGFSLSTEEGRDEFAEAVRRGLVSDTDDVHKEFSTTTEDSRTERNHTATSDE